STVMQRIKGRSSRKIQVKFPDLRKRYWGRRFRGRGYFSTTSGNVTDDIILQYLELHSDRKPTGIRWQWFSLSSFVFKYPRRRHKNIQASGGDIFRT
ncbi:MAG: transposase, partial [Halocynthiibacter sp.]